MRKKLIAVLTTLVICALTACASGGGPKELAFKLQEEYAGHSALLMNIAVRADYGEKVYDYRLSCEFFGKCGTMTITAPENIAGVGISVTDRGLTLSYDGAEVFTGAILPSGLSPADAVPLMVSSWIDGLITEAVREKADGTDCLAVNFLINDETVLRTWFSLKTHLPVRSEISSDGFTVIICDFENVRAE